MDGQVSLQVRCSFPLRLKIHTQSKKLLLYSLVVFGLTNNSFRYIPKQRHKHTYVTYSSSYVASNACVLDFVMKSFDAGTAKMALTSSETLAGSTSAWLVDRQTRSSQWCVRCSMKARASGLVCLASPFASL